MFSFRHLFLHIGKSGVTKRAQYGQSIPSLSGQPLPCDVFPALRFFPVQYSGRLQVLLWTGRLLTQSRDQVSPTPGVGSVHQPVYEVVLLVRRGEDELRRVPLQAEAAQVHS